MDGADAREALAGRSVASLVVVLALAPALCWAQGTVAVDPPDRLAHAAVLGDWPTAGDLQGWVARGARAEAAEGVVTVTANDAADAILEVASLANGPDLDLGFNDFLQLRIRVPADYSGEIRLAYGLSVKPGFGAERRLVIPAERMGDVQRLESKHFCFWWSPHSRVVDKDFDPAVMGRRALRMSEECYQVYCKQAGYREPFENAEPARRDGQHYKVNITTWYQGTWMGGQNGWTYLNVPGWGLRDEGWGNPVLHEFGHALQGAQPGFLTGAHWESHANYLSELRNRHFGALLTGYHTRLERCILEQSCLLQDHFRHIYRDFRVHIMLDDLSEEMGLGSSLATKLWTDGPKEMTAYAKLALVLPPGQSVKDTAGRGLRHWVLLDFSDGANYKAALWGTPRDRAAFDQATGSFLEPCQDRPGWWRVPWARAPMRYGFMYHELAPDAPAGTVTVELRGLDMPGSGEDWRWSLVAATDKDEPRYSDVWGPGRHSFTLRPGETRLFVVVVATPDVLAPSPHGLHNAFPVDKHPHFLRYPYELRLAGARPALRAYAWPQPAGPAHPNGGGWVADTAQVDESAYVGPHARVLDRAKVTGRARIEDYAVVADDAVVEEDTIVSGWAWVGGRSVVQGQARVRDHAQLWGETVVEGEARLHGYVKADGVKVRDQAVLRGNAWPWGCTIKGHASADYDYSMNYELSDGVHFNHVPWGEWFDAYYAQTLRKPRGLIASYRIEEPEGEVCWDEFGALHAVLRGRAARVEEAAFHSRVLRLDGRTQYLALDRSVCDTRDTSFGLWCRPSGARANRPLVFLGSAADRFLKLTARDGAGRARCAIQRGPGASVELASKAVTPADAWTHLAVTLADGNARLYVNGQLAAERLCDVTAESLLAPNDYSRPQANYVGRDWGGALFAGRVEDVRFYNVGLTAEEVALEMQRAGHLLGLFLPRETEFDGRTTALQSGVRNGLARTLTAWIRPRSSDDVAGYEAVFDSRDERDANAYGSGVGLDNGQFRVRLDGLGFWDTGVPVALDRWQHVALAFGGTSARLYVDGREAASTSYSVQEGSLAAKNYRIGFTQASEETTSREYFHGLIRDARIYDRALAPTEVQSLVIRTGVGAERTRAAVKHA